MPDNDSPRAFGYCLVSTVGQEASGLSHAEQERKVRARAAGMDWSIEQVFVDVISGSTPLAKREQSARLLSIIRPGDVAIGAKLDRLFRSAADCLATIEKFKQRRVELLCLDVGSATSGGCRRVADHDHVRRRPIRA
jgi:putative DNA-invertase from lambdoid prophage Rac